MEYFDQQICCSPLPLDYCLYQTAHDLFSAIVKDMLRQLQLEPWNLRSIGMFGTTELSVKLLRWQPLFSHVTIPSL